MTYLNPNAPRTSVALGCARGACACGARDNTSRLAEAVADPRAQVEQALRTSASEALRVASALGVRNESWLTDLIFGARHPERRGRPLQRGDVLTREWLDIRDRMVRPTLTPPARGAMPGPTPSAAPAPPCPVEDPFPASLHKPGTRCAPDGRKCWPQEGWLDLVDADMPCNDESRRSPAAYAAVLDYFNVAHPANARYAPHGKTTYCNIYVHDVTRAMRASVPHWIRDPSATERKPLGWRELNANGAVGWLRGAGPRSGWLPLDPAFRGWISGMNARRQSIAPPFAVAPGLASAASRVAAEPHNPAMLLQDAYLGQRLANLGLPVVIAWMNPNPEKSGHVAMVRPETAAARGQVDRASGLYVPLSAQAGHENFELGLARWIVQGFRSREIYVHA